MEGPIVSIIIVNWNGKKFLAECFSTLFSQTYKNFEIIFVDNGSTDGSIEFVKNHYHNVRTIALKENTGFSKGNNVAIDLVMKEGKSDLVFLLNNDVKLDKHALEHLVKCTEHHPDGCIFGPKMPFYDKPDTIWSAGVKFNKLISRAKLIGLRKKDSPQYNIEREVDQIAGAGLMVRCDAIGKERLNEQLWSYIEETEFEYRVKRNTGMKAYYCPKSVIFHKVAGSSGGGSTAFSIYYLVRNRAYFIQNEIRGFYKLSSYLSWIIEVALRLVLYSLKLQKDKIKATFRGALDFFMNKKGVRK